MPRIIHAISKILKIKENKFLNVLKKIKNYLKGYLNVQGGVPLFIYNT